VGLYVSVRNDTVGLSSYMSRPGACRLKAGRPKSSSHDLTARAVACVDAHQGEDGGPVFACVQRRARHASTLGSSFEPDPARERSDHPPTEGKPMNWDRIKGNWKQVTGNVKSQWGKLTDDDLDVVAGHRDQLAGKIQERYGIAKDEAEKQLAAWQDKASDSWFKKD
jgi:uncharacterized protein YjbJ (UPF0337 family)